MSAEALSGVFVVVPAYNEGSVVKDVVRELVARGPRVVVVDDGSTDNTSAASLAGGATVLRHGVNRGQGAALQTGIAFCIAQGAEIVVTFDGDGQHDPEDVAALIAPIRAGLCEITMGSRFLKAGHEIPISRRWLLQVAARFTRLVSRVKVTDAHNGLRAFSRRAAQHLDLKLDRMAHASEIIDQIRQGGFSMQEVPVHIRYTDYSRSKGQHGGNAFGILADYLVGRIFK
jgi:glycosyltransferase involved in cell wall biosynthesis